MIKNNTMKYLACFLSALVILSTSACKKDGGTANANALKANAILQGKWKVIGNMISSGGPMYFVPDNGNHYVEFNANGAMSGPAFPDFTHYAIKDSVTLNMTKTDKTTYENYYFTIKIDTLTLSPTGPLVCVEGCDVKLVKE